MSKFRITTLGCKVNQAESEAIAQDLLSAKWVAVKHGEQANVCIVNTCTVTRKASMQSRQAVRQTIRANPHAQIVVTGCYAQTAPDELRKINGIDYIIGHSEKPSIGPMIRAARPARPHLPITICSNVGAARRFDLMPMGINSARTRPFLKIQDGCDAFCTYCIVPFARGPSRSMPLKAVLDRIGMTAAAGYHEIVLTGIHLGAYGRDLNPAQSLLMLMERVAQSNLIDRVRLSSIEPLEITAEIIQCMAQQPVFCRHLHIPLQSGDDGILAKMKRPYTRKIFHGLIAQIHRSLPDAAIGVDTLIGFPGENEQAFEHTYALIEELPVSYLHVFPFSPRPGTQAAGFAGRIPDAVIKNRCRRMRRLGREKRIMFHHKFVGQTLPILIETRRDAATGLLKGISSNYLPVLVEGGNECQNTIVNVRIEKSIGEQLFGTLRR